LSLSNVVAFGTLAQAHSSVPHSQAPYTWIWVAADALPGRAVSADSIASTIAASAALPLNHRDVTGPRITPPTSV